MIILSLILRLSNTLIVFWESLVSGKKLCDVLFGLLSHKELIPEVPVDEAEHKKKNLPPAYKEPIPEPFEKRRINEIRQQHHQPPIPEKTGFSCGFACAIKKKHRL